MRKTTSQCRRELRAKRELLGFCVYCGKHPPVLDKKGCSQCLEHKSDVTTKFCKRNQETVRQYHLRIKHEVIAKYGGKCNCCGELEVLFLTIDHVHNDGYAERKEQGNNSKSFYLKLRRESLREDLQVLCWNCNFGKVQNNGICPHVEVVRLLKPFVDNRRKSVFGKCNKINWPEDDVLIDMCNSSSISATAKELGVDGSSITRRLKLRNKYDLVKRRGWNNVRK